MRIFNRRQIARVLGFRHAAKTANPVSWLCRCDYYTAFGNALPRRVKSFLIDIPGPIRLNASFKIGSALSPILIVVKAGENHMSERIRFIFAAIFTVILCFALFTVFFESASFSN